MRFRRNKKKEKEEKVVPEDEEKMFRFLDYLQQKHSLNMHLEAIAQNITYGSADVGWLLYPNSNPKEADKRLRLMVAVTKRIGEDFMVNMRESFFAELKALGKTISFDYDSVSSKEWEEVIPRLEEIQNELAKKAEKHLAEMGIKLPEWMKRKSEGGYII